MKNEFKIGDRVVENDTPSIIYTITHIDHVLGTIDLRSGNKYQFRIHCPSTYTRFTKIETEKIMAPKFNIDDKVFRKKYRTNTPSTITTVTKSRTGRFLYLLDNDTYDNHCENDWEDEFDLVHENEYPAFVEREKQTKIAEFKSKIIALEKQIKELENGN